jgi:hypothetical protein
LQHINLNSLYKTPPLSNKDHTSDMLILATFREHQ